MALCSVPTYTRSYLALSLDVSQVEDFSGFENVLTPVGTAPTLSSIHDVAAYSFRNGSDALVTENAVLQNGENEIFIVMSASNGPVRVLLGQTEDDGTEGFILQNSLQFLPGPTFLPHLSIGYHDGVTQHSGYTAEYVFSDIAYVIHVRIKSNGDIEASVNGGAYQTLISPGAPFVALDKPLSLGGRVDAAGALEGEVGAILIYNTALNQAEANHIINYLAGLYNIALVP